ncbi:YeiH family protein [Campylobacter geochelonis]|uniref:YeiH family protein n=1 Tax=Campylobacter geochelonis TaxID=1780362 RepID=UPI000770741B|nr:putative sulfate exporter family transporter [Campylobacter geochelonis]CZE47058.1 membrane-fusion protein [Campylobacter geochelonis]
MNKNKPNRHFHSVTKREKFNEKSTKKLYFYRKVSSWVIIMVITSLAFLISELKPVKTLAISPLIIAVILGAIFANTAKNSTNLLKKTSVIAISTKQILRLGIIFYGFRITVYEIALVGVGGVSMAFLIVFTTFFIGYFVGRMIGLDKKSCILISAGSSICGAAAVLATESIVKGGSARVGVAVCTVVVFGTMMMFVYPLLFKAGVFDINASQMGFYMGGTLHEVAHAVAAGCAVGGEGEELSVIIKMLRVLMLVPFLMMMGVAKNFMIAGDSANKGVKGSIPYFAIWFLVAVGVGSLFTGDFRALVLPYLNFADTILLSVAMVALGLGIRKDILKSAGKKPFILAFILLCWLVGFGYVATLVLS